MDNMRDALPTFPSLDRLPPRLPILLDHTDHHNEWRKCVTVHLGLCYSCDHSSLHIQTPRFFFFKCHRSDRGTMTALTLIPVMRLCLLPVHDKVSDMKGYGTSGKWEKRGSCFWKYVAPVWLTLTNWSSAYTGTTQQIKLLIHFTPVSNPTWTNETCPYSMSIWTPQELRLMFTQK